MDALLLDLEKQVTETIELSVALRDTLESSTCLPAAIEFQLQGLMLSLSRSEALLKNMD